MKVQGSTDGVYNCGIRNQNKPLIPVFQCHDLMYIHTFPC